MPGLRKLDHLLSHFYLLIACLSIDIHCLLSIFAEEDRRTDLYEDYWNYSGDDDSHDDSDDGDYY